MDLARFLAMALLVGVPTSRSCSIDARPRTADRLAHRHEPRRRSGGAFAGVLGLSTGPCSVVGCGAPVLPVVGLVFAGLSSGTLALLSSASRVLSGGVLVTLTLVVARLGWQAGRRRSITGRVR